MALLQNNNLLHIENWEYYEGDQFKYWVGAMPNQKNPSYALLIEQLEKIFVCANLVKECVDRHVNAFLGDLPAYNIVGREGAVPPTEIATKGAKIIDNWIDANFVQAIQSRNDEMNPLIFAVTRMVVTGRAYLRLFVRERYLNSPLLYQKVSLHCPDNGRVKMIYDDEGSLIAIEYLFDDQRIERQELDPVTGILHFYIYRNQEDQARGISSDEYELDLNFQWTIYELKSPPLVTESVKRQQNAVNLVLTMLSRNVNQAGFLERLLLNASPPGEFIREEGTNEVKFIPDPQGYSAGAGVVSVIRGIPLGNDPTSPEGYTNPSVVFREPVSVDTFDNSLRTLSNRFYHEFGQGHILADGDGSINGVSRIQLANDFANVVSRQKTVVTGTFNNVFYTLLLMLGALDEAIADFRPYTVSTELKIKDHLLTPEEHNAIREDFKAGIISQETTLTKLEIEDVQAEMDRVAKEREATLKAIQESVNAAGQPVAKTATNGKKPTTGKNNTGPAIA